MDAPLNLHGGVEKLVVEGPLSAGPTPSSFMHCTYMYIFCFAGTPQVSLVYHLVCAYAYLSILYCFYTLYVSVHMWFL